MATQKPVCDFCGTAKKTHYSQFYVLKRCVACVGFNGEPVIDNDLTLQKQMAFISSLEECEAGLKNAEQEVRKDCYFVATATEEEVLNEIADLRAYYNKSIQNMTQLIKTKSYVEICHRWIEASGASIGFPKTICTYSCLQKLRNRWRVYKGTAKDFLTDFRFQLEAEAREMIRRRQNYQRRSYRN